MLKLNFGENVWFVAVSSGAGGSTGTRCCSPMTLGETFGQLMKFGKVWGVVVARRETSAEKYG